VSQFRVGAVVRGPQGELGKIDALIVDPTSRRVTHLVVLRHRLGPRVLVPERAVLDATPEVVSVSLDDAGIEQCDLFDEPSYDRPDPAVTYDELALDPGSYFLEPYVSPIEGWVLAEHERIPKGEVSIRRGDDVLASDGSRLGQVDEFLVDPADGHITHIVLRQGHVFRHDDDVLIPVGSARFDEGQVVLDLDAAAVEALPKIPVQRHRHVETDRARE
jgi:sporulation protein YlmC with PRC-barrel domain